MRNRFWVGVSAAAALVVAAGSVQAQQFFRIGTGGTAGTYYPIGGMIANAISTPGKLVSRPWPATARSPTSTPSSAARLNPASSRPTSPSWAYSGTGVFEGKPKIEELRSIANLYPESVHLVVRKGSGVKSVADLKGKRVSLDEPGSGTLLNAKAILAAYGIGEKDITPEYLKPNQAATR